MAAVRHLITGGIGTAPGSVAYLVLLGLSPNPAAVYALAVAPIAGYEGRAFAAAIAGGHQGRAFAAAALTGHEGRELAQAPAAGHQGVE